MKAVILLFSLAFVSCVTTKSRNPSMESTERESAYGACLLH